MTLERLYVANISLPWFENLLSLLGGEINAAINVNFPNLKSVNFHKRANFGYYDDKFTFELDIQEGSELDNYNSYSLILYLVTQEDTYHLKQYEINVSGKSIIYFSEALRTDSGFVLCNVSNFTLPKKVNYFKELPETESELIQGVYTNFYGQKLWNNFFMWVKIPDLSKVRKPFHSIGH